ncbi:MAG: DUF5057 domain-containing protein [Eubacteriales bacterium]|nr:DUF5057 domain-containing protein [Eubacteriales bacterium]
MSKKNKILAFVAAFALLLTAGSVISYSLATKSVHELDQYGEVEADNNPDDLGNLGNLDYMSNIDWIIQNSHEDKNYTYNIVEIFPNGEKLDGVKSDLEKYITLYNDQAEGFKKWVIDANKEKMTENMSSNKINYIPIVIKSDTTLDTKVANASSTNSELTVGQAIENADLIYLTSKTVSSFNKDNDMCEDIYTKLNGYCMTLGNKKPIIIDKLNSKAVSGETQRTYGVFANDVKDYYKRYRTIDWDTDNVLSALTFFQASGQSHYIWFDVRDMDAFGNILFITNTNADTNNGFYKKLEDIGWDQVIENAYTGDRKLRPKKIETKFVTPQELEADVSILNGVEVEEDGKKVVRPYDFIFIENDVENTIIPDDVYAKLRAIAEKSEYIIYEKKWIKDNPQGSIADMNTNFHRLYKLLVNNNGDGKYKNILTVEKDYFNQLNELQTAENHGVTAAKNVADLINGSVYRGHGGDSESDTSKYRVLEIQPCYPIDLELAKTHGDKYYTQLDEMSKDLDPDAELIDGQEHYQFELSKAKIAHLTGLNYNQIQIDHMSSEELISSKKVISETYDLVYIGGDTSAITSYEWTGDQTKSVAYRLKGANMGDLFYKDDAAKNAYTNFNMFTHTGLAYNVPLIAGRNTMETKNATMTAGTIGNETNQTVAELNGNDITSLKLEELQDYVDSGLPVIIEKRVAEAFVNSYMYDPNPDQTYQAPNASPSRLAQLKLHDIDPDSNMYQFLKYAYVGKSSGQTNISWGDFAVVDGNTVTVSDSKNQFGANNKAIVYSDSVETPLRAVIGASNARPRMILNEGPMTYVDGNDASTNYGTDVNFDITIRDINEDVDGYDVYAYYDMDGNGIFSDSEAVTLISEDDGESDYLDYPSGTDSMKFSFKLDEDFVGAVNWKIVAKERNSKGEYTGTGVMLSDVAYFRPESNVKKEIRVLQIIPLNSSVIDKYNNENTGFEARQTNGISLYFCTECQQAMSRVEYNIHAGHNNNDFGFNTVNNQSTIFSGKVNSGLHEHEFGIVRYLPNDDTSLAGDDWEDNLADPLTHGSDGTLASGEYKFDLDIMTVDEFDDLWDDAEKLSAKDNKDELIAASERNAKTAKENYETALKELETDGTELYKARVALENELHKVVSNNLYTPRSDSGKLVYKSTIENGIGIKKDSKGKVIDGPWIKDRKYYKFWEYFNDIQGCNLNDQLTPLVNAYNKYIALYDEKVVKEKNDYKKYKRETAIIDASKKSWLTENYDMVVLGFAEDFGGQDVSKLSASQLKKYIDEKEGAILNTHDTMTRFKDKGAINLTNALRETFGQDRFHAGASGNSKEVVCSYYRPETKEVTVTLYHKDANEYYDGAWHFPINGLDKDCDVYLEEDTNPSTAWSHPYVVKSIDEASGNVNDDMIRFTIHATPNDTIKYKIAGTKDLVTVQANAQGIIVIDVPKAVENKELKAKFSVAASNLKGDWNVSDKKITVTKDTAASGSVSVELTLTDNGESVPDGRSVKVSFRGNEQALTTKNSKVSFTVDTNATVTAGSLYDVPANGVKYRKFDTADGSKYFWTQRGIFDESQTSYAKWEKDVNYMIGYNTPIGVSDSFIFSLGAGAGTIITPYRYAYLDLSDAVGGQPNASASYDMKYGTRRASQVNKGCVTTYPFTITSELRISGTHAQYYALDLDDPTVSVWYTLAASAFNKSPYNGSGAMQAYAQNVEFKMSSNFAASPHDGMDAYYLYSKENVYYCGAGHATVTGTQRDNNDERRLFINVIVNSVKKAKSETTIKLYNKCSKHPDEDCSCEKDGLVTDKKTENAKLAKEKEKLFYVSPNLYQYNVEDYDVVPEFDFKVIPGIGAAKIKTIDVFYDLDYYDGLLTDKSNEYKKDDNHVLIRTSDLNKIEGDNKTDNVRYLDPTTLEQRLKLRETGDNDPLKLKPEYFKNYRNYTYIVIHVEDEDGNSKYARIKISLVPKLFDLTDANFNAEQKSVPTYKLVLDLSDKFKFNM